jgi:hypothetical protein
LQIGGKHYNIFTTGTRSIDELGNGIYYYLHHFENIPDESIVNNIPVVCISPIQTKQQFTGNRCLFQVVLIESYYPLFSSTLLSR